MLISELKSIREVDESEWNKILGSRDFTHSHAFLLALENSKLDCVFRYIVMRNSWGEIVAHANLCVISTPYDLFLEKHTRTARLLRFVRKFLPGFLVSKVVECGSPVALGRPFVFRQDLYESERKKMLEFTYESMNKLSKEYKAEMLVVRDFSPGEERTEVWKNLVELGFVSAPNLENTVLSVNWSSFDDYLKSLRSNYRAQIRNEKNKSIKAGIRKERVMNFAPYATRLTELWRSTADHAVAQLREHLNADFFSQVSQCMGEKSFVTLFWLGDKIVAFTLYFDNGDELVPLYVGIDYTYNAQASLVFNAYYDWIETAIELGYRHIDLGITTYEPKLRIGARLEKLTVLMRHRYSWLTQPAAWIYRWLTPQQEIEARHVFRQI